MGLITQLSLKTPVLANGPQTNLERENQFPFQGQKPALQSRNILQAPKCMFPFSSPRLSGHTLAPMPFDHNLSHHSCFTMCIVLDNLCLPHTCLIHSHSYYHNSPWVGWFMYTSVGSAMQVQIVYILSQGSASRPTPPDSLLCLSPVADSCSVFFPDKCVIVIFDTHIL